MLVSPCLHDVVLKLSTGATVFRSSCGHHRGRFEAEIFPLSEEFVLSRKRPVGLHETGGEWEQPILRYDCALKGQPVTGPYLEPEDYTPHPPIQFLKYTF
jgi:hypothetical protein